MIFRRIISPSLSPNTETDDVIEALRVLVTPSSWQEGEAIREAEQWFTEYLDTSTVVSFDSGRSALLAILRAFDIGVGDEVLVQAFTCVAVPNSVRWAGAKCAFVDIDDTLNIDPKDIEKKVSQQSKAIVVQHTFGVPAQMDKVIAIAKKHGLFIIEDCAHSLGATYQGKRVGTLGDAALFSFGRDKVVSSVWGGVATLNIKYQKSNIKYKLKQIQENLSYPSHWWILQQLSHPVAFAAVLPMYNMVVGKVLLEIFKRVRLLSVPVYEEEKKGHQPSLMPRRYPNALARLLVSQLAKLARYNDQRRRVASYYWGALRAQKHLTLPTHKESALYLRFPVLVDNPAEFARRAKRQGILLGNWYHNVIDPKGVDLEAVGYVWGSCPRAQDAAAHIINLPTRISDEEAREVVAALTL